MRSTSVALFPARKIFAAYTRTFLRRFAFLYAHCMIRRARIRAVFHAVCGRTENLRAAESRGAATGKLNSLRRNGIQLLVMQGESRTAKERPTREKGRAAETSTGNSACKIDRT